MKRSEQIEALLADPADSIARTMASYSLSAVKAAVSSGFELDYSERSLNDVEALLEELSREIPKGMAKLFRKRPSDEDLELICKMYGGYIGEVMRFEWGGEWCVPEEGIFAGALVLRRGDSMTSPPAKVFKRLIDGAGDDVVAYYNVLKPDSEGLTL